MISDNELSFKIINASIGAIIGLKKNISEVVFASVYCIAKK